MRRKRKKLAQVARIQARGLLYIPKQGEADDEPEFDDALAAFGLQQVDDDDNPAPVPHDKCYLWPCNVDAFVIWQQLQTQWRVGGMGVMTGLDYTAVIAYLRDVRGMTARAVKNIFPGLRAMESAALDEWSKKQAS